MPVLTPNALERRRLLRAGVVAAGVAAGDRSTIAAA